MQALKAARADFVLEALAKPGAGRGDTRRRRAYRRAAGPSGKALNLDDLGERRAIVRALSLYEGNVSHAAQALA